MSSSSGKEQLAFRIFPEEILQIACPQRPDRIPSIAYDDEGQLSLLRQRVELMTLTTQNHQTLKLVDKSSPHSQFDLMIVAHADNPPLTFSQLSPNLRTEGVHGIATFARYATNPQVISQFHLEDSILRISANIDLGNNDRFSIQGERALHIHMLTLNTTQVSKIESIKTQNLERKVADPLYNLGPLVISDLIFNNQSPFYSILTEGNGVGFESTTKPGVLKITGGWNAVDTSEFGQFLASLDIVVAATHHRIMHHLVAAEKIKAKYSWERPSLLPIQTILDNINRDKLLSDLTKSQLVSFASRLRNIPESVMSWLKARRDQSRVVGFPEQIMGYASPTYTLTFFTDGKIGQSTSQSDAYLAIQPVLTRTSGAAGLVTDQQGRIVIISKNGSGEFTPEQMRQRQEFQFGFMEFLQQRQPVIAV